MSIKNKILLACTVIVITLSYAHSTANTPDLQWFWYDWTKTATLLFLSGWLYFSITYQKAFQKALSFFWLLDSAKEFLDMSLNGDSNDWLGLYWHTGIFAFLSLLVYYHCWQSEKLKDTNVGAHVSIVISKPKIFRLWFYMIFGLSRGNVSIKANGYRYHFSKQTGMLQKNQYLKIKDEVEIGVSMDLNSVLYVINSLDLMVKNKSKWSLYNNCGAQLFPLLFTALDVPRPLLYRIPSISINSLLNDPNSPTA